MRYLESKLLLSSAFYRFGEMFVATFECLAGTAIAKIKRETSFFLEKSFRLL